MRLFKTEDGKNYLLPFILVTTLFALWGFANDITNPMVAAFKNILLISNFESSLVQFAFYGGYCFMAIPAALFIRKFNYKNGILVGLALYSCGCLLFIPAGNAMAFGIFLFAYFVMTCGLAFLETTSNPYILAMGPTESATRRLNFAQAFNPIGSLTGMLVAKEFILSRLNPASEAERQAMAQDALALVQKSDLDVVSVPYLILGLVVGVFFIVFLLSRLPKIVSPGNNESLGAIVRNLLKNRRYIRSVVAQTFYVGVQIMVWTFIIQYAEHELNMPKATAQGWNMVAMAMFVSSRFICTFLLKYFRPSLLLTVLAIGGALFTVGAIFLPNAQYAADSTFGAYWGLYCIVAISACMSLMFPTIYGIALKGMGEEAKLASAGLILAIGGGCIMPPAQGWLIDKAVWFGDTLSSARISFVLPLLCFIVIGAFGNWCRRTANG
ncbi:MAG: L-fucose:H+ symporter permease [Bacteroidales bacterium]|jgi:FHS family L-fucose permease-like MFS transporter|nr:L-fucose:H+ symporter permease [Bacteroidales bacterium]